MTSARERIDELARVNPEAVALARVLSLAVRIEPELLRQARLLIPQADASAEADLWFSDLVSAQSPRGITLDVEVAEELSEELGRDPAQLERSWSLIESFHRDARWSIRVEETIHRLSLSAEPADRQRIEDLLLAAAREMKEAGTNKGPARWMLRALRRLPAEVRDSPPSRMLAAGAGARLDGRLEIDEGDLPDDAVENWFSWLLPQNLERVEVGVRLLDGALEMGAVSSPDVHVLALPKTRPLMVDVTWHDGLRLRQERLRFQPGETRRLRLEARTVELGTALGEKFRLGVAPTGGGILEGGIDFSAVRAAHRPFFGREEDLEELTRQLSGDPLGQSFAIVGGEGIGKTALLCRLLDRLESQGVTTLVHFLRREPAAWSDPHVMEASLFAQLRSEPQVRELLETTTTLAEAVEIVSEALPETPAFCVAIDVDGSIDGDETASVARPLFQSISSGFYVIWAAREPPPLEAVTTFDLDERKDSNEKLCRAYLAAHWEELERLTEDPQKLRHRAEGLIGRLVQMHEWLRGERPHPVDLDRMPPTLYGGMQVTWDELRPWRSEVVSTLKRLTVAFEPLERAMLDEVDPVLHRAGLIRTLTAGGGNPERVELSHPTVRDWLEKNLDDLRSEHVALLGSYVSWKKRDSLTDFQRRYSLRYLIRHLLEAGVEQAVHKTLTDLDFLTEKCVQEGVDELEAELARAAGRFNRTALADDVGAVLRAVRDEAIRLREHPDDLPSLVDSRLRAKGEASRKAVENLHSATGRPFLRLRHLLRPSAPDAEAEYRPVDEPLKSILAISGRAVVAGAISGRLYHWRRPEEGATIRWGHSGAVHVLRRAPGSGRLLSAAMDGSVRIRTGDGKPIEEPVSPGGAILDAMWLGTGQAFAVCSESGVVQIVDEDGRRTHLVGHGGAVTCCALIPGRTWLVTGSADCSLRLWDLEGGRCLATFQGHRGPVTACQASSGRVLSADGDGVLKLWTLEGENLATLGGHRREVTALLLDAERQRAVSSSLDGTVRVWDLSTFEEQWRLSGHRGDVVGLIEVDGAHALSYGRDATCRLWHLDEGTELRRFDAAGGAVRAVTAGYGKLFAATDGGTVETWPLSTLPAEHVEIGSTCALDVKARRLLIATGTGPPNLWDAGKGSHVATLSSADDSHLCASAGDDEASFATFGRRAARLWNEAGKVTRTQVVEIEQSAARATALTMAPGRRILIGTSAGEIWSSKESSLLGHSAAIRALATHDRFLLSAADDSKLLLWDLEKRQILRQLGGHRGPVTACAFSPDGRRALSGGEDHVLALWDVEGGTRLKELRGHTGTVTGCAFAGCHRDLAVSASSDGTLRVWNMETGKCIETFYGQSPWTALVVRKDVVAASDRSGWGWVLNLPASTSSRP